jgi:hypothetical protein
MITDDDMAEKLAGALASGDLDADSLVEALSEMVDPEEARREAENRKMRVQALGTRLYSLAQEQVQQRQQTEERWYKDVRQFNGQYDPGTFTDGTQYGSKVYVPLTRRLVGLVEARLFDMLFPSDERSYVIEPTPVPDLDQVLELSEKLPPEAMVQMPEGQVPAGAVQQTVAQIMDEAKKRCDGMQREIDDQLAECSYPKHARDVIHDAVLYGTGVLKGPVPMFRTTKKWEQKDGVHVLSMERKPVPEAARVDLWNFFPDMSATHIREAEFVFERHYLTKQQVASLQDMPDVDVDSLRELLEVDPTTPTNNYRERLRAINGASGAKDKRYEIWEYHGPIDAADLISCGCEVEDDPLKTYTGVVWFGTGGVVLKAALNPLDSNEHPYSVFTWQQDESSIFGFGMPYEVRDAQESANSSFRAMLDNMGLCVLPQVIVDDAAVEPVNLAWGLEPGKFWRNKRPGSDARQSIQFVEINARFPELQGVFQMSKQLIEEVGTLPAFLQGQEAPSYMQSATGASIAYTAANLWVRRAVRNWDDDVVTPLITRFFDFNMQYSEKEAIKGDSRVRAMGITALVELEGQAQRLTQFMQVATQMGLPPSNQMSIMREFARAFKLDPDRVLPTDKEIEAMKAQEQANGGAQPSPEMLKLQLSREQMQAQMQIEQAKMQLRREEIAANQQIMQQRMQLEIADTAAKTNMTQEQAMQKYGYDLQKTQAEIADKQADRAHEAQMLNAEMQLKAQLGSGI